jgi:hypothetical protein
VAKYFVLLALCVSIACGQNGTAPLTNETIMKLVASGVPIDTIIKTIQSASSENFNFLSADIALLQSAKVPDIVIRAMSAKAHGQPMPEVTASLNLPPQQSPIRTDQPKPAPAPSAGTMTNDSLVKLVKAGMGDDAIVSIVNSQPGQYSLSTDSLIALKQAGVSDKIIAAMVNRNAGNTRSISSAQPSSAEALTLHDATPVRLRLTRNLSSADAKTGDTIDFEVLDDVKVDDVLVIARGATAIATVTEAQAKRRMARGGKLDISIDYVRLVNGDKVALKAVKDTSGGGHTGAMTGAIVATSLVVWPAAPFFLFMHGKDSTIPKDTEITAYVNGEIKLDRQRLLVQR